MKKILFLGLFLFLAQSVFADKQNSLILKFGITPYSIFSQERTFVLFNEQKNSNFSNINIGTVFYLEYYRKINSIFKFGIGYAQQIKRNVKDYDSLGFTLQAFYISPKVSIYKDIYSILQIGVSKIMDFDEDIEEENLGLHYGLGIGYEYKNFIFEFLYASDNEMYKLYLENILVQENRINYQTFNFNIGYKFDFNFPKINRAGKEPKKTKVKEHKQSEKELLREQNELLKKQIELLEQKIN
ncbi:MAG: porin family protein [Endomicrobium sp.]|jgi:hypothetical protein|nr:porin family protein [Endomicrobium sp.]